jgi:peptidoglycan/LPS O-acetylase OafA/YrhL
MEGDCADVRRPKLPALERLGDASYGIYLMHVAIVVFVTHALISWFPRLYLFTLRGWTMAISLVGASAFGLSESKVHARVKRWSMDSEGRFV